MFRQLVSMVLVACLAAQQASAVIPVGGLCAGIAGPVNDTCVPGSKCCSVGPDRSLCTALGRYEACPSQFIEEGGLCSGIAGPSPYPCIPGTTCCYVSPDNSQCLAVCPGK